MIYSYSWHYKPGVRFTKASLANNHHKLRWTLLVMMELMTTVAFRKHNPVWLSFVKKKVFGKSYLFLSVLFVPIQWKSVELFCTTLTSVDIVTKIKMNRPKKTIKGLAHLRGSFLEAL